MFAKNVGTIDRIIRTMIGLAAFGAGIYFKSWWGALGVIPIATAVLSRCGVYSVFGLNTCQAEQCAATQAAKIPPKA